MHVHSICKITQTKHALSDINTVEIVIYEAVCVWLSKHLSLYTNHKQISTPKSYTLRFAFVH